MKIGIMVHSDTGNTLAVAQRLQAELEKAGHSAQVERVAALGGEKDPKKMQLEKLPVIDGYDALALGAPVQAFNLSQVMKLCLPELPSLHGKKVVCFVTQFFPFPWMGGNNAIGQIKQLCSSKKGKVLATGIVNWSRRDREQRIAEMVEQLSKALIR